MWWPTPRRGTAPLETAIVGGLRWGELALRGRCDTCPMPRESMGHRASRRAYPEGQFAPMKWVNIKDLWYNRALPNSAAVPPIAAPAVCVTL